jgi:amylosucrase
MRDYDLPYEASRTLRRIWPQVIEKMEVVATDREDLARGLETLERRFAEHWPRLFDLLMRLYGEHYDFFYYAQKIVLMAVESWLARPPDLRLLDVRRENDPSWYLSERMVGGSLYVDLFSGDLSGLRKKIPYLRDLGLTYLHLMPLFLSREGNSDGGYAIRDYRQVHRALGSMEDLRRLAEDLRGAGISLVLDFVFNHTADTHDWAIRAQEGDREYMDYYYLFSDRILPDQYEQTLREIFPTVRRGNFSWHEGMQRWVWTTFNSFQWDLNYANPDVFRAMAEEMLFLGNTGVEILRLDAVAFIWKRMGSSCENLEEAHWIIQAFNAICRIAAPGLAFKSEAIVHPDEVVKYISTDECQISYNPTLMALLWEAIATRETKLLKQSVSHRQNLWPGTAWVNYLRGHDDIGWSFANADAEAVGIRPDDHRRFLNEFYIGRFPGSFAEGVPFQFNADTGDMRVSGTMASLVGLEQALLSRDSVLLAMAMRRIRMLYGILCSIGGIPLIFLGEEWGVCNDHDYLKDADKKDDSRWIHRPSMNWEVLDELDEPHSVRARLFRQMQQLFAMRKECPALSGSQMRLLECTNPHVLLFLRWNAGNVLAVLANFSEVEQSVDLRNLRQEGFAHFFRDLLSERTFSTHGQVDVDPYDILWLVED